MGEATLILAIAVFVLGVPLRGDVGLLYVGMSVYLAAVIGVGLFISVARDDAATGDPRRLHFFAPAVLLSGFVTPVENMPDWLQPLTLIDPMRYFVVIARGVFLKDMPAARGRAESVADGADRSLHPFRRIVALPASPAVDEMTLTYADLYKVSRPHAARSRGTGREISNGTLCQASRHVAAPAGEPSGSPEITAAHGLASPRGLSETAPSGHDTRVRVSTPCKEKPRCRST